MAGLNIVECTVSFAGSVILDHVSLDVPTSTVVGIKGDNGSGKSTLLRVACGLIKPDEGTVKVFGQSPNDRETRSRIGAAIDTPALYGWMSGIGCLRALMDISGQADSGRSRKALERFGLGDTGRKRVFRYSQGMRKRLSLAGASLREPDLLLLDEPTNALDPDGRNIVYEWIEAARDGGATVLLVSHRDEDSIVCDRVFELSNGHLEQVADKSSKPSPA